MSTWTWKQAVADIVLNLVNSKGLAEFSLRELHPSENELRALFPGNQHVPQKIRQVLQQLRDDGFLEFVDGQGNYRLNCGYPELAIEVDALTVAGPKPPEFRTVVRNVRLRNTLLAADMKRRYANVCQVCREAIQLTTTTYAEAHHLRPLGGPHFGADIEQNIIVVRPNHHVMFDRGALYIDLPLKQVLHRRGTIGPFELYLLDWHKLDAAAIEYATRLASAG